MDINLNLVQTLAISVVVLILGIFLKKKIYVLRKYFLPTPIIGGLVFALFILIGHQTSSFSINLDQTLTPILLIMFFTATGFTFSVKELKKTGVIGLKLAIITILLVVLQNLLVPLLAKFTGIDPLLGLTMGSMSLAGGPGTSAAFGPTLENMGIQNATVVAISASTFGMIMGSIIGGPVAKFLLNRHKGSLNYSTSFENKEKNAGENTHFNNNTLLTNILIVLIAMGIGTGIVYLLNFTGFVWPDYVGGLFAAAIIRNVMDHFKMTYNISAMNSIGTISLNIFLVLTIMDLKIWELINLAMPMFVFLLIQTIFMMIFASVIVYRFMGKNYDSIVMASGISGVGLGSTPNAVANMEAVIEENGPSPNSMLILPVIVAVFLSALNPILITIFINIL